MPYRILVVDDDKEFRSEFRQSLGEYEVVEAESGEQALGILKKPNEIDLVILDIKMHGMSGTQALQEIRRIDPKLGVIILTGYGTKDVLVEALKGRADDYIEKPFDVEKTKAVIGRVLKEKFTGPAAEEKGLRDKVDLAKYFTKRNVYKKVGLEDIAKTLSLNPKYLSRLFKEESGVGFAAYKLDMKMKEAKRMLHDTSMSVNSISDKLGYKNAESFIRMFKKMNDITPLQFRKTSRQHGK